MYPGTRVAVRGDAAARRRCGMVGVGTGVAVWKAECLHLHLLTISAEVVRSSKDCARTAQALNTSQMWL